jgi:predicted flap endonuclease-1-like 5' DNA nuclease
MGLFEKLKSLLGLGGSSETDESTADSLDVGITVEREGDDRDGHASTSGDETAEGATAGGTGSTATTTGGVSASDAAATTGSGSESDTATATGAAPAPETETDTDTETDAGSEDRRVPSEAVDVIKGIGPTYAGRLSNAGIETVDDLAAADAAAVADSADVPEGRLEDWIERAKRRSR